MTDPRCLDLALAADRLEQLSASIAELSVWRDRWRSSIDMMHERCGSAAERAEVNEELDAFDRIMGALT